MVSNREISRLLGLYGELLLLHDRNAKLAGWASGAAYRVRRLNEQIADMSTAAITKLFPKEIADLIGEIKSSGRIASLDEMVELTPSGLFEMMRIKGLGGKKLSILWKTARVDTVEGLMKICRNGEISNIPGFGEKTRENIMKEIDNLHEHEQGFRYAAIEEEAVNLVAQLQTIFKTKLVSVCGELRRQCPVLSAIEIITALPAKQLSGAKLKQWLIIQKTGKDASHGHTLNEIPVIIYHSSPKNFATDLFRRTGNMKHIEKVYSRTQSRSLHKSEASIYAAAALPFIVPELREDVAEWNFAKNADDLLRLEDITGVVHNHTTYSDGVDSLSDFAKACKVRGFQYVVISDHSKNAHYAGGLKEDKVLRQLKEIDELNRLMKPFRIFKSIECDILVSGELDYGNDFLKHFDMVIISIHQLLKMNEEKATSRLIRAIENPYTTILGHMTGRQLLIRPGYPVNFKKVIDACASNKVVIEVNANPYRLDMDWSHIPYAIKRKVMISINPDAHSIREIDNIKWGVSVARKGGLTKKMTWNAMSLPKINAWLKMKRVERS